MMNSREKYDAVLRRQVGTLTDGAVRSGRRPRQSSIYTMSASLTDVNSTDVGGLSGNIDA